MLSINILIVCSQQINCRHNEQTDLSLIRLVLSDYIKSKKPDYGIIIRVEYLQKDKCTTIFSILESISHYELFYRKPQCYFIESDRIIYIITDKVATESDTVFFDNLFYDTLKTLYYSNKIRLNENDKENILTRDSYRVSWYNDSIISMKGVATFMKYEAFDPTPVQYVVNEGEIKSKKYVEKVLFPDNGTPKGTIDYLFRKLPYWKTVCNSDE